jgi:hypothetical protein
VCGPASLAEAEDPYPVVLEERSMRITRYLMPRGRHHFHSWASHVGIVDHSYGPNSELAWVRTLCGRRATMNLRGKDVKLTCKTCQRVLEAEER